MDAPITRGNEQRLQAPTAELTLSEAIQHLPPELQEIIYKEYLAIEKRQQEALSRRELMGWGEVHYELLDHLSALYDHES